MHFQNKNNNEKPEKDHEPKQKLEEKMKIDGYSKHTHSLTHIHPPPHTQDLGERRGKGGFDRHTLYKTRDYNINRKEKDAKRGKK